MGFEEKTSFELARPVADGLETILPILRSVGRKAIVDNIQIGVLIPGHYDPIRDSVLPANIAGRPRFREYDKIRLPFLRYVSDQKVSGEVPDFHRLASLVNTQNAQSRKIAAALKEIPTKLAHIAFEFGSINAETAEVKCHGFSISPSVYKKGFELAINVVNPERFKKENAVYAEVFSNIKTIKPYTRLDSNEKFDIPLAWFNADATVKEQKLLLSRLKELAPSTYKVNLGPILRPFAL